MKMRLARYLPWFIVAFSLVILVMLAFFVKTTLTFWEVLPFMLLAWISGFLVDENTGV